ncbi:VID27 cytoplasmic protein-domain-containing protein [Cladochytrium replicatum]|nr:VID27 cytoplasmic protein-domain-containing protein [Cladochytrium replicatum]
MFLLKALGDVVWGRSEDSYLQLTSGQLIYHNTRTKTASKTQCVFKDATATIRKTTTPFNYQFIISRVFEEGEEELEETSDEPEEHERTFLIDEVIGLRKTGKSGGPYSITWADPDDDMCSYEYAIDDGVNEVTVAAFEQMVYHCMFERRYKKAYSEAQDEEIEKYVARVKAIAREEKEASLAPKTPTKVGTSKLVGTPETPATPFGRRPMDMSAAATPTPARPSKLGGKAAPETPVAGMAGAASGKSPKLATAVQVPKGEILSLVPSQLFVYNIGKMQHEFRGNVEASLIETEEYKFVLYVRDENPKLCCVVDDQMNGLFFNETLSFQWNQMDESEGFLFSWSLRFPDVGMFDRFRDTFVRCVYEAKNQEEFEKMAQSEKNYIINAFQEDVEMSDAGDWVEDEEEEEEEEDEEEDGEEADDDDEEEEQEAYEAGEKNSHLVVGYKHERSFVSRGNKIGVFKYTDDDQLAHHTTINGIKDMKGATFSPRKLMLHEQDSSMLLMAPNNPHSIFRMDLEAGKVVEEWNVDDIMTVDEILPENKYAQMTPQKTLIGINHNAIFRIDPRLSGKKRVDSESKQYVTKNQFSCAATTGKGELAVASEKGDIRLFNKLGIRAKTALPGLGDPIIGIDTTENGRWIVATCKTYILLVNTEIPSDEGGVTGSGPTGFQKPMGEKKPHPKRLQLKPEHVAWMGTEVNFTPAHFNAGEGDEKSIVTSTGPFVITWNFRRVKQGKLWDYQIKKYADNVVADNFKFGADRNIIVTLPGNVEMVSKTRLQTPTKMLKSRNGVVNSPY